MLKKQIVSTSKWMSTNSSPFFKGKNVMALKIDQDYPNLSGVSGGIEKVSNLEIIIKEIIGKTFP